MRKLYTTGFIFSVMLLFGCSKDILKSYDKRIVGTWEITDVKNTGLLGSTSSLTFTDGTFTFYDNGTLTYINSVHDTLQGSWNIIKKTESDEIVQSLQISAASFTTQQVLSAYYDDIDFLGTDYFTASTKTLYTTYVTHYRR